MARNLKIKPRPDQYHLSICAIFKNEARYLKEWIEFHRIVGVEHFYLYNNNSTDDFYSVLESYVREGTVDLYPWEMHPGQVRAYADCILIKAHTKWLAFIDIDEFLFPVIQNSLPEALNEFDTPDISAVCVFWESFNSSGQKKFINDYVINRFKQKIRNDDPHVKSIVRPERVIALPPNPHLFVPKRGFVNVDENQTIVTTPRPRYCTTARLCINHYWTKSLEEWGEKRARGRAGVKGKRNKRMLLKVENYPTQFDDRITRFLPFLKERVLLQDTTPQSFVKTLTLVSNWRLFLRYCGVRISLRKTIIKPWMTYEEILVVKDALETFRPQKCLEWGTGYGTLYFPHCAGKGAQWFSVEHDSQWAVKIKGMNKNPNILITHVPPNHFPWSDEYHDGAGSDLQDYIEFPGQLGPFDFVLVDGRARKDCLRKAYEMITEKGLVILHDAERRHYHQPFELYPYQFLFDHARTGIRLWIGSRGLDLNKKIDFTKYENLKIFLTLLAKIRHLRRSGW